MGNATSFIARTNGKGDECVSIFFQDKQLRVQTVKIAVLRLFYKNVVLLKSFRFRMGVSRILNTLFYLSLRSASCDIARKGYSSIPASHIKRKYYYLCLKDKSSNPFNAYL